MLTVGLIELALVKGQSRILYCILTSFSLPLLLMLGGYYCFLGAESINQSFSFS